MTNQKITLGYISKLIETGKVEWVEREAVMVNHGTDGAVRYQQLAKIDGVDIMIYWDTTPERDRLDADYTRWYQLVDNCYNEDEEREFRTLDDTGIGSIDFDDDDACDWDNPADFEILD